MNIIYEDEDILIVNKPAGLATETASVSAPSLYTDALKYRKSKNEPREIYIVHRLDQPVSGLIVLAKNKAAAASLSKADNGFYSKTYTAGVYGRMLLDKSSFTDYLLKDSRTNLSRVVDKGTPGSKESRLEYEVISSGESSSLVRIKLITGRHHQIRVQFANNGHPLLGDLKYGTDESIGLSQAMGIKNVCLCASSLKIKHPTSGELMSFDVEALF